MLPEPVDYIICRNGLYDVELPHGKAYVYALAGNGLFKYARNDYLEALIQLESHHVAGLPHLAPDVHLRHGRLPARFLERILADARRLSSAADREAMYQICHTCTPAGRHLVVRRPDQAAGGASVDYVNGAGEAVLCDVHSHHRMGAFFSGTDDRDEQGFRFYAVIGRIFSRPEIRLRIGVYGDTQAVPATTLFAGLGPFKDAFEAEITENLLEVYRAAKNRLS